MSTPTNPTPAEIAYLERDIAERVMRWERYTNISWLFRDERGVDRHVGCPDRDGDFGKCAWSPWNNAADALEVLERLQEIDNESGKEPQGYYEISQFHFDDAKDWGISFLSEVVRINGGLQHIGPAVCELARKVMEEKRG